MVKYSKHEFLIHSVFYLAELCILNNIYWALNDCVILGIIALATISQLQCY